MIVSRKACDHLPGGCVGVKLRRQLDDLGFRSASVLGNSWIAAARLRTPGWSTGSMVVLSFGSKVIDDEVAKLRADRRAALYDTSMKGCGNIGPEGDGKGDVAV